MTISGKQETTVRPTSWQSSDFNAGIPIKKRRFFIHPPSPPTEEASSTLQENGSERKEQSSPSQGSAVSNASDVAASVSCSLDANESTASKEKRSSDIANPVTVQSIIEHPKVKIQEPSPSVHSASSANIEKRETLVEAENSGVLVSSAKSDMKLAPTKGITERIVYQSTVKIEEPSLPVQPVSLADVGNKEKLGEATSSSITVSSAVQSFSLADVENKEKLVETKSSNILVSSEITAMKVASTVGAAHEMHSEKTYDKQKAEGECMEHLVPVVAGKSSCQYQENVESLSLNLSLSKGQSQNKSDISICSGSGAYNGINRSNWDLNTTMDTWEGSLDGSHDVKLSSSLSRMVSASFVSEERSKDKLECRSDTATTSSQSDHQYNPGCSLSLGLSSFCLLEKSSSSSASLDKGRAGYMSLSRPMIPSGNVKAVNFWTVKSEPLNQIVRDEPDRSKVSQLGLSYNRVKHELAERCNQEAGFSSIGFLKSTDLASTKPESANRVQREALDKNGETSNQPGKQMINSNGIQDFPNCSVSNQLEQEQNSKHSGRALTCSTEMALNSGELNCSEYSTGIKSAQNISSAFEKAFKMAKPAGAETISSLVGHDNNNWNVSGATGSSLTGNIDDCKYCELKETPLDSCEYEESSQSDEEKINLSGDMLEEELCGSDYESDGGYDLSKMNKKQDGKTNEFEDGEVRGSVAFTAVANTSIKICEVEYADHGDSENKSTEVAGLTGHDFSNSSHIEENVTEAEDCEKSSCYDIKECMDASHDEKIKNRAVEDSCLIQSVEMSVCEVGIKRHIQEFQRKPLDVLEEKNPQKNQEGEHSSYQLIHASKGISGAPIGSGETVQNPDMVEKNSSVSYKAEVSRSGDVPPKDATGGANQSRIINLTRVSSKSPGKTLDASGSFLPLRTGRERLPDLPLEAEKFLSQGRDEDFVDDSYKFSRERHHDQLTRNPRLNYMSDKRRVSSQIDTNLRDHDSESKLASKFYGGRRIKYDYDLIHAEIEFDNYGNTREDGTFVRSFRRGRRLSNDEATFFSNSSSRRHSPGFSFMHRGQRNISPDRCAVEDGSVFNGHRNSEKFMRRLPRDNMDAVFTRPHRPYNDLNDHFVRGHKNFSPVQRRGLPRFRSRSPTRSRARSPVPYSSFRSRSPDVFVGPSDLPRRRSSPNYRRERMRSPDHSCFSRDMVIRRHGLPFYSSRPSNALRDMESGRGRGYRRSLVSFRNQSGRVLLRRGKFDMLDHRERTDCDDFFEGSMHSGRVDGFEADGNIERRRFLDRRDTMCSFGPSFSGDDCEPDNVEDDPDAIRFCQEDGVEIDERRDLREFDKRNKDCTEDVPRRARNIKEKAGSSRHGREIWQDEEFDGITQTKIKRF